MSREKPARAKKESQKKRESKVGAGNNTAAAAANIGGDSGSTRATPDPKARADGIVKHVAAPPSEVSPLRYKLAPPKPSDFEPARSPVFTHHHDVPALDGSMLSFYETSEQ